MLARLKESQLYDTADSDFKLTNALMALCTALILTVFWRGEQRVNKMVLRSHLKTLHDSVEHISHTSLVCGHWCEVASMLKKTKQPQLTTVFFFRSRNCLIPGTDVGGNFLWNYFSNRLRNSTIKSKSANSALLMQVAYSVHQLAKWMKRKLKIHDEGILKEKCSA